MSDQEVIPVNTDSTKNTESMADDTQWKTEEFRAKVRSQIQEVIKLSDVPVPKTSEELEEQIFAKAAKREEYLTLAAKIIIHIRDLKTKSTPPAVIEGENGAPILEES